MARQPRLAQARIGGNRPVDDRRAVAAPGGDDDPLVGEVGDLDLGAQPVEARAA